MKIPLTTFRVCKCQATNKANWKDVGLRMVHTESHHPAKLFTSYQMTGMGRTCVFISKIGTHGVKNRLLFDGNGSPTARRWWHASASRWSEVVPPQQEQQKSPTSSRSTLPLSLQLSAAQTAKVDALFHKILWLDMFETSMLTELINEQLGIRLTPKQRKALQQQMDRRDAMLEKQHAGGDLGSTEQAPVEEAPAAPKTVDLRLVSFDDKSKIKVIKEVRALLTGLGLKEAKELVESAPAFLQKALKPDVAAEWQSKLEAVGAKLEIVTS